MTKQINPDSEEPLELVEMLDQPLDLSLSEAAEMLEMEFDEDDPQLKGYYVQDIGPEKIVYKQGEGLRYNLPPYLQKGKSIKPLSS